MKTGKTREFNINPDLQQHIQKCFDAIKPLGIKSHVIISQIGGVYSIQRINVVLKEIKLKYHLSVSNFSSHSLRKTFGREIYNISGGDSEALILLMTIFGHSSPAVTVRYLGIKKEQIAEIYSMLSF